MDFFLKYEGEILSAVMGAALAVCILDLVL